MDRSGACGGGSVTTLLLAALVTGLVPSVVGAKILCISHRGCRLTHPENTVVCFEHAVTVPVDWIETDVWLSKDQVPVLHHDRDMCRTTNIGDQPGYDCSPGGAANNPLGRLPWIEDFTLAELKALDVGSWFDPAFTGTQMPTLEEGIEVVQDTWANGQVGIPILLDCKAHGLAPIIKEIMDRRQFEPDSIIIWNRYHSWDEFKAEMPGTRRIRGYFDPRTTTDQDLADLEAFGEFGISAQSPYFTQAFVDSVRNHNLFLYSVPVSFGGMPFAEQAKMGVVGFHRADPDDFVAFRDTLLCADGVDNDGDSFTDIAGFDAEPDWVLEVQPDPECVHPLDEFEVPQCGDGVDNDGDSNTDYPFDPGCDSATDLIEFGPNAGTVVHLRLAKTTGSDLKLTFDPSCSPADDDYGVFEGTLGNFTSHSATTCTTLGATTVTITPSAGDRYYLVVPQTGSVEGSYGLDSDGIERPESASCAPQALGGCG